MIRSMLLSTTALLSLGAIFAPAAAMAQTSEVAQVSTAGAPPVQREEGGGDIVVTARNRAESLQTVPLSISVLSQNTIDQRAVSNVSDVAKLTPGLQFDKGATPGDLRPSLRGIPLIEGRSNVALLVDGVDVTGITLDPQFGGAGSQLALGLLDLAQVEVVKGPQSVHFGRSAFAGAINFISAEPGNTFEAKILGGLGNYGDRNASVHISVPIIADVLSVKVSGMFRDFDGYYQNPGNGLDLGGENSKGIGGMVVFTPTSRFKARAQFQYMDQKLGQPAGYSQARAITTPTGVNIIGSANFDPDKIAISTNIDYKGNQSKTYRGNLSLSYDLTDALTLSTLTGINRITGVNQFDWDQNPQNTPSSLPLADGNRNCQPLVCVGIGDYDINLRQISQEARLAYDNDTLHLLGGLYYFNERYRQPDYTRFVGAASYVTSSRDNITPRIFGQNTETKAAFGSVEFDPIADLKVGAEVRYSEESVEAFGPNFSATTQQGSPAEAFRRKATFKSWTPRFTIGYDIDTNRHLYASAARGTKPGGFNLGQVIDAIRPYGQETIWTYEVGTKTSWWDRRIQVDLAAYYSDWRNVQVTTVCFGSNSPYGPESLCPDFRSTSLNYIVNADKARIKGVDLDIRAKLTPVLTAGFNYAYSDSKFVDFLARAPFPATPSTTPTQFAGNRLPLIPKHSLQGTLRFEHPVPGNEDYHFFAEESWRWRSSRYSRFDNRVRVNGKAVGDAQVGINKGDWFVLIYVENVLNNQIPDFTRYYPRWNPSNSNGEYIAAPTPRTFGTRFRYVFR